ncbi:thioredoxin-dependent thiol peroxidase [Patescibacteria group bacterium]|nr:thioredoxin-dependent thiol peroxidase [Patescibacteria group bacterium]
MLTIGDKAPDFRLNDQKGEERTLAEAKGKWVLIYFYPKDDTPGCTKEACQLRDNFPAFRKLGVEVFGVSVDSVKSHEKFVTKYELPFVLLADDQKEMVQAYGVWGERSFIGHKYMGTSRTSFLVDPQGKIAKIYESVKPAKHAEEVLNDLKTLQAA